MADLERASIGVAGSMWSGEVSSNLARELLALSTRALAEEETRLAARVSGLHAAKADALAVDGHRLASKKDFARAKVKADDALRLVPAHRGALDLAAKCEAAAVASEVDLLRVKRAEENKRRADEDARRAVEDAARLDAEERAANVARAAKAEAEAVALRAEAASLRAELEARGRVVGTPVGEPPHDAPSKEPKVVGGPVEDVPQGDGKKPKKEGA